MEFADACYVCGVGDEDEANLLVCDKCDYRVCHIKCLGLKSVPEGEWFCDQCILESA